jgi:crossover junction endodeoxyribonuclease RusA
MSPPLLLPERMTAAEWRDRLKNSPIKKKKAPKPRPAPAIAAEDLADLPPGLRVVLPFPPVAANPNWHGPDWIKNKEKRKYRIDCGWHAKAAGLTHSLPCIRATSGKVHFRYDFFPPAGREPDEDNMDASFKAGQDGIADAIRVDDKRFQVERVFHAEQRGCVVVTLLDNPEVAL